MTGSEATMKKTMTLNLTDAEMQVLDDLSVRKDLSKTAVLRQALRLYQAVELRVKKGDKLVFENESTREKAELMLL
jgi:predicted transcriptional regulator